MTNSHCQSAPVRQQADPSHQYPISRSAVRLSPKQTLHLLLLLTLCSCVDTPQVDEMRTFEFLNTAAGGDDESVATMLSQGISPNTADYDGRTALMLASAKGHEVRAVPWCRTAQACWSQVFGDRVRNGPP